MSPSRFQGSWKVFPRLPPRIRESLTVRISARSSARQESGAIWSRVWSKRNFPLYALRRNTNSPTVAADAPRTQMRPLLPAPSRPQKICRICRTICRTIFRRATPYPTTQIRLSVAGICRIRKFGCDFLARVDPLAWRPLTAARCSMTAAWIFSVLTSYRSTKSRRFAACSMQHGKHYSFRTSQRLCPRTQTKTPPVSPGGVLHFARPSPPPAQRSARAGCKLTSAYATPFALKCASSFAHPSFAASALYVGR